MIKYAYYKFIWIQYHLCCPFKSSFPSSVSSPRWLKTLVLCSFGSRFLWGFLMLLRFFPLQCAPVWPLNSEFRCSDDFLGWLSGDYLRYDLGCIVGKQITFEVLTDSRIILLHKFSCLMGFPSYGTSMSMVSHTSAKILGHNPKSWKVCKNCAFVVLRSAGASCGPLGSSNPWKWVLRWRDDAYESWRTKNETHEFPSWIKPSLQSFWGMWRRPNALCNNCIFAFDKYPSINQHQATTCKPQTPLDEFQQLKQKIFCPWDLLPSLSYS